MNQEQIPEGISAHPDLISVIIPAYNAARSLPAALAAAQGQTHQNLEILIVDDGSQDETGQVARNAAARDDRVRVIAQSNQGVAAARNAAIAQARGAFIAPLDADDVWHRRKLELQLDALRRSPGAKCAYCWQFEIDEEDRVGRVPIEGPRWEGWVLPVLVLENFVGSASTPLISRSALVEIGGYDETLRARNAQGCEDWKVSLLLAERFPFAAVPLSLTGYRQVRQSMSTNTDTMLRSFDIVLGEIRNRHPELPPELFRWSRSKLANWLAYRAWHAGDLTATARMASLAIRKDPWLAGPLAGHAGRMIRDRISAPFVKVGPRRLSHEFEPEHHPPRPHLRGRVHRRGLKALKHAARGEGPVGAPWESGC